MMRLVGVGGRAGLVCEGTAVKLCKMSVDAAVVPDAECGALGRPCCGGFACFQSLICKEMDGSTATSCQPN